MLSTEPIETELLLGIVRVEARFSTGDPKRGTGFRVGPAHVLTAQHVVERRDDDGQLERSTEILVSLASDHPSYNGESYAAKVGWPDASNVDSSNPSALDVVILKTQLPSADVRPFRRWIRVPLGESGRWQTWGFPVAIPEGDETGRAQLWGRCDVMLKDAVRIKLTVERNGPVETQIGNQGDWKGVSGAPVFTTNGRYPWHLYGVICESPENFPGDLVAVGTPALLCNRELRNHLGIEDPPPHNPALVEDLRCLLNEQKQWTSRLVRLDQSWHECWQEGGCDELVDFLCRSADSNYLDVLTKLVQQEDNCELRSWLGELGLLLVALIVGPIESDPSTDAITGPLYPGTASSIVAEARLAHERGQPPVYEKVEGDLPRPVLQVLTSNLDAGILGISNAAEEMQTLVEENFVKSDLDPRWIYPAQRALFQALSGKYQDRGRLTALEENFRRLREEHGGGPYLMIHPAMHEKLGPQMGAFLKEVAKNVPTLQPVILDKDPDAVVRAIKEDGSFRPLWLLLGFDPEE